MADRSRAIGIDDIPEGELCSYWPEDEVFDFPTAEDIEQFLNPLNPFPLPQFSVRPLGDEDTKE